MNRLSTKSYARNTTRLLSDSEEVKFDWSLLGALKTELVRKLASQFSELDSPLVNQAVNEAQSLAAQTAVPLLVLPVLAEEKVRALRKWMSRQRALRQGGAIALAA